MRFEAFPDLFALGLNANRFDKILGDFVVNIRLKQRHPYLTKSHIHMLGRKFALATQIFQRFLEFVG